MGEPKSQNRHRRGSGLWAGDELTHPPGLSGQPEGTSSQRGQEGGGTSSQRGQEGGRGHASSPVPSPTSSSPLRDPHGQIPVGHPGQGTWERSPGWSSAEGRGLLQTNPGSRPWRLHWGPECPLPADRGLHTCSSAPSSLSCPSLPAGPLPAFGPPSRS